MKLASGFLFFAPIWGGQFLGSLRWEVVIENFFCSFAKFQTVFRPENKKHPSKRKVSCGAWAEWLWQIIAFRCDASVVQTKCWVWN